MTRFAASVAMIVCCAGAAVAQSQTKSACCSKEKAEAVVQTVAAKADGCCAEKGAAQTVAQVTSETDKQCCADKAAKAAAAQLVSLSGPAGECAKACSETSATQVAQPGQCSTQGKAQQVALAADVPAMQCKVGEKVTSCTVKAGELAAASGEAVQYVVAGVSYESAAEASQAHAAQLASYLDTATRVQLVVEGECVACPVAAGKACDDGKAMTYRVAGRNFESAEMAVRAAAAAYAASRQVNLSYVVDGEPTSCSVGAKTKSMATAQPVVYRVGEKETRCDVQASVMLATARIEAALGAVESLPQS